MRFRLNTPKARQFWASRGAALVGITALHVAGVAVAMVMKGPQADAEPAAPPIEVVMMVTPEPARPPDAPVRMPEITPPTVIAPIINIDMPPPAPTTITVTVAPPVPPPAVVSIGDVDSPVVVTQVSYLRQPVPVYPQAARRARVQGIVQVRAVVDEQGKATEVRVHRSSGFDALDRAACDAVYAALFKPYVLDGAVRRQVVIVPVNFNLSQPGGRDRVAKRDLKLDVRGEHHHALGGHPEELGSLSTAALHVGE